MKQAHMTVTQTWTPTPTDDITKIMMLQVGAKFIYSQDHRTLGFLVVSILPLEVPVD
jgi:hypothetical protein